MLIVVNANNFQFNLNKINVTLLCAYYIPIFYVKDVSSLKCECYMGNAKKNSEQ